MTRRALIRGELAGTCSGGVPFRSAQAYLGPMKRSRPPRGAVVAWLAGCTVLAGCTAPGFWSAEAARDDAQVLQAISLTAKDVAEGAEFSLLDGGDEVIGQVSLDLCRADFPSEAQRRARHQIQVFDEGRASWLSSEALLYSSPAAAQEAMSELARAAADCEDSTTQQALQAVPTADDSGLSWRFAPAPDSGWPEVPGVARQAYQFQVTDPVGDTAEFLSTYLRRGRVLVALYVTPPGAQSELLVNDPSQQRLVAVISNRMAGLPTSEVF